jgi:hypothetical protein
VAERQRIGFDRTISSEWLDAAAARALCGEPPEVTRKFLWDFLEDVEPGTKNNSGRGKTLTVLTRIWVSVPFQTAPLRQAALRCIASTSGEKRIGIHWAMVLGTHPFFFDVATHLGKLIKLNGQANRSQIKRRMTEAWGDRSTLERTIQHVLRSIAQWGMLCAGVEHGSLVAPAQLINVTDDVAHLLIHSVLLNQGRGLRFSNLINHAALFPFALHITVRDLMRNPIFRVQRQGDQSDIIELARGAVVPLPRLA